MDKQKRKEPFDADKWMREIHIINDDTRFLSNISEDAYRDFLNVVFDKADEITSKQQECAKISCSKRGTKRCGRCHQMYYCSAICQKQHWKSHKKVCKKDVRLQRATIFSQRYSAASLRKTVESALSKRLDEKNVAKIINEFAFPNSCICPQWFIQSFSGKAMIESMMNSLQKYRSDDTALVIVSAHKRMSYIQVPRHPQGLCTFFPVIFLKRTFGADYEGFVMFVLDQMVQRFPDVLRDGNTPLEDLLFKK